MIQPIPDSPRPKRGSLTSNRFKFRDQTLDPPIPKHSAPSNRRNPRAPLPRHIQDLKPTTPPRKTTTSKHPTCDHLGPRHAKISGEQKKNDRKKMIHPTLISTFQILLI